MRTYLRNKIFNIKEEHDFRETALEVFHYQFENNEVYRAFVIALGKSLKSVREPADIPFLPIEFFRNHKILTGNKPAEMVFESSGTTGVISGKHYVTDLSLYQESFKRTFSLFFGDPEGYLFLALLPSYTEREGSSLVYMANTFIQLSRNGASGFAKPGDDDLIRKIKAAKQAGQKVLLLGVSFALLDLAEKYSPDLSGIIVMETGGMKGRRKEITRAELHGILKEKLNVQVIHSEYGMTELLSQAYSRGDGLFYTPPWMKVVIRDPLDPLSLYNETDKTGGINITDLANINSCSFIATGDLGKIRSDGGFEVLGRFDNSDIRGCNLLVE